MRTQIITFGVQEFKRILFKKLGYYTYTTRKQRFCVGQKRTQKVKNGRLCVGLSSAAVSTKKPWKQMETRMGQQVGRMLCGPSPRKMDATRRVWVDEKWTAYAWAKPTHNLNIAYVSAWATKMKYIYIYIYIYKYIRCCVGQAHAKADAY